MSEILSLWIPLAWAAFLTVLAARHARRHNLPAGRVWLPSLFRGDPVGLDTVVRWEDPSDEARRAAPVP